MNRIEAISNIEQLFPIDSDYPATNKVGEELLMQAIKNVGWQKLSDEILVEYARLCIDEDCRQADKIMRGCS